MRGKLVGLLTALALAMIFAVASPARAHDYDRENDGHLLRLVAYAFYPVGMGLEYGIMRPIHQLVSQPKLCVIFGHEPRNQVDENGNPAVCALCKPAVETVECPNCHKMTLKPVAKFYSWH